MFDSLRQFLEEITGPDPAERDFGEEELRIAAAALLVHVAEIDGFFGPPERRALLLLLQQRFDLDADAAHKLLADAQKSDHEAVDLYGFTSILQQKMDIAERRRLVEMMWTIAYADGELQEFEENVIWRVSELLSVPARDRIALRRKIRGESGCDPDKPGPWGQDSGGQDSGGQDSGDEDSAGQGSAGQDSGGEDLGGARTGDATGKARP
jgi:uncharacterized tellurite resistance protein B-like protein